MPSSPDGSATLETTVNEDVATIGRIAAVPTILEMVAHTTGLRFAAVGRVTETTWTACAVHDTISFGVTAGTELPLHTTLCGQIRLTHQPIVFSQASTHPDFCNHPTPRLYGFESYISVPIIRADGRFFGTLFGLDTRPVPLEDPHLVKTLSLFAQLVSAQLDAQEKLQKSETALLDAQETAALREQFIAVLGHDLRNPLQSISAGAAVLAQAVTEPRAARVVGLIQKSCGRMTGLIENVLDLARGRLGGGIPVAREHTTALADELQHVIAEAQATHPERSIRSRVRIDAPVHADSRRLGQMLSNLMSNALHHGADAQPIEVEVTGDASALTIAVANGGKPIPAELQPRLFQPFSRAAGEAPRPGLGLGLYIVSEIARAHGGKLTLTSDAQQTRVSFEMLVQ